MKTKKPKRIVIILLIVFVIVAIGFSAYITYSSHRMNQLVDMTFEEMLDYTTSNNDKAVITVGIIQNGEASYTVYGINGTILPQAEHVYEIGSLTKTFTAALIYKAIYEGRIALDDSIDKFLDLPKKEYYPTIRRLVTHTSGYESHYFEPQMISNFLRGRNDFYGISGEQITDRIRRINLEDREYDFNYSNFGYAVIGLVLAEVYGDDYTSVMNRFIAAELGLHDTKVSDSIGDLGSYWDWQGNDAYIPAGALTSTIEDMLIYAGLQLGKSPEYIADTHEALAEINATTPLYADMNIRMDSIGVSWMIDDVNNIAWHNGGTDDYNCYLGFDYDKQIAVVILSNLPPDYRIPATMMGARLLIDLQETDK